VEKNAKYLQTPTMIGKSKKEVFKALKDHISEGGPKG